jgi:hypothetical protein
MTAAELIVRLDGVRKTTKGWVARCPGHNDRSPSLSIREGDTAACVIHCWGGCEPAVIVGALGLTLADLYDTPKTARTPGTPPHAPRWRLEDAEAAVYRRAIDLEAHAYVVLRAAVGLDTAAWTPADFDHAVLVVCRAYERHELAARLAGLSFAMRATLHDRRVDAPRHRAA